MSLSIGGKFFSSKNQHITLMKTSNPEQVLTCKSETEFYHGGVNGLGLNFPGTSPTCLDISKVLIKLRDFLKSNGGF